MTPWAQATTALALLAIDPGLGGMVLRCRASPVRDALEKALPRLPLSIAKLHPAMSPDVLDDGIDIAATLAAGTLEKRRGLLEKPATFVLSMAERSSGYLSARLANTLDQRAGHIVIALDEGTADEATPASLADRLAFHVDLNDSPISSIGPIPEFRQFRDDIGATEDVIEALVNLSVRLGIDSLRAPALALRAAKAHALLHNRDTVTDPDISAAVALVFAHRATRLPHPDETQTSDPPSDAPQQLTPQDGMIPEDMLLDAVKAALPPVLLDTLSSGKAAPKAQAGGAGRKIRGRRRGRPLPARQGGDSSGRPDLIATLRAAVPWQTLRQNPSNPRHGPVIRKSDLRYARFQHHSDRLLIFTVDASGSAAMARLGEAKGAIELLLAQAYASRDQVALVSFRKDAAEVLLEPTRSLVQTKRKLADLPGGGGTPLAAGLIAAQHLALQSRNKGLDPHIVLLTDGRSNIALDGAPDRKRAAQDAGRAADALATAGLSGLVIDTGRRPEAGLAALARRWRAGYLPLPRADAQQVSAAVSASFGP
ncbi:magnesium chelatase subunit D [Sulfitobacter sp. S190]|uniref:magnesium chelatase subunit D n=1 Tax=Sulfitobacter sp. S190 TaxID=2867022 RepID=UPI0021A25BB6|nr:magnesium chelatase subunit D [Sulfitobacter sp. S190]UWR24372.1 magnesium chelatase subunit D [Sulfitobacter sp. S190]